MINLVIAASLLIILAIVLGKLSKRLGVSSLLIFIVIGLIVGTDQIGGVTFNDFASTEKITSLALALIMFYGGFGTNWKVAKPVAKEAIILSSLGTIGTAVLVGLLSHYLLGFRLLEGMLLGAVISSTDAASVFSILRQYRLNLKDGLASLLEIESGSNDPFANLTTFMILLLMAGAADPGTIGLAFVLQISLGIVGGLVIAFATMQVFKRISFGDDGLDAIFVLAIALLAYAGTTFIGGNGYIAVYLAGIIIGNTPISSKRDLVHFFDGITTLSQIVIFFLFGLLANVERLGAAMLPALAVFLVLTFIARPIVVILGLLPFKRPLSQITLVSFAGLRGAASLVFAIFALSSMTSAGTPLSFDLYKTVFWIVIFSIALQGTLLPFVSKLLNVVDDSESVMKTFTDYEDDSAYRLIEITITEGHPWADHAIADVDIPSDNLILLIRREDDSLIPQGSTVIRTGDQLVMHSPATEIDQSDINMIELPLYSRHPWINHSLKEIDLSPNALVVLVRRDDRTIVPDGDTRLRLDDVLLISGELPKDPASVVRNR